MSPPTGVQARPVATPGRLVRIATSLSNCGGPEYGAKIVGVDPDRPALTLGDADGDVAQGLADLALEVAHAGLARVALDDVAQGRVGDLDLLRLQAVGLQLPPHQVAPGDLQLLVRRVAGERDDLHAVAQRAREWCRACSRW